MHTKCTHRSSSSSPSSSVCAVHFCRVYAVLHTYEFIRSRKRNGEINLCSHSLRIIMLRLSLIGIFSRLSFLFVYCFTTIHRIMCEWVWPIHHFKFLVRKSVRCAYYEHQHSAGTFAYADWSMFYLNNILHGSRTECGEINDKNDDARKPHSTRSDWKKNHVAGVVAGDLALAEEAWRVAAEKERGGRAKARGRSNERTDK